MDPKPTPPESLIGVYADQLDPDELDCLPTLKNHNLRHEINLLRVIMRRFLKTVKIRPDDPNPGRDYLVVGKLCVQISNLSRAEKKMKDDLASREFIMSAVAEASREFTCQQDDIK
jgi:hypothetical protein